MSKPKKSSIEVQGVEVAVLSTSADDYISLTDIARYRESASPDDLIRNWLRNRNTVEFLGLWEQLNNSDFNPIEFDGIRLAVTLYDNNTNNKQHLGIFGLNSVEKKANFEFKDIDYVQEFAITLNRKYLVVMSSKDKSVTLEYWKANLK